MRTFRNHLSGSPLNLFLAKVAILYPLKIQEIAVFTRNKIKYRFSSNGFPVLKLRVVTLHINDH